MFWILIHFDVLLLGQNFFSPNLKVTKKVKGQAFPTVGFLLSLLVCSFQMSGHAQISPVITGV